MNLMISITNKCNLKCDFCFDRAKDKEILFIEVEELVYLLNEVNGITLIDSITITGGEPLLHKEIIRILKICKKYAKDLVLITNLTLINYKIINEIYDLNIKLHISYYCNKKNLDENNFYYDSDFLHKLTYIRASEIEYTVYYLVTNLNYDYLENILLFLKANIIKYNLNFVDVSYDSKYSLKHLSNSDFLIL